MVSTPKRRDRQIKGSRTRERWMDGGMQASKQAASTWYVHGRLSGPTEMTNYPPSSSVIIMIIKINAEKYPTHRKRLWLSVCLSIHEQQKTAHRQPTNSSRSKRYIIFSLFPALTICQTRRLRNSTPYLFHPTSTTTTTTTPGTPP